MAECLEDSYCSSTIIFPHTRPHISTNLISRFLLSTLAAEAWRSNAGSAKFSRPCGVVHLKTPWWWYTLNTGVVHLKTPGMWYTLNTGVVFTLKHQGWWYTLNTGMVSP